MMESYHNIIETNKRTNRRGPDPARRGQTYPVYEKAMDLAWYQWCVNTIDTYVNTIDVRRIDILNRIDMWTRLIC